MADEYSKQPADEVKDKNHDPYDDADLNGVSGTFAYTRKQLS